MPAFEERIATARRERGMTQEQLAEAMNVSRQTVSHWENGRATPDDEARKRLSELLGLDEQAAPAEGETAARSAFGRGRAFVRLFAAFACGVLATVFVVYGLLPLFAKKTDAIPAQAAPEEGVRPADHPFAWYQQPAAVEAGKAYLKLTPDHAPVGLVPSTIPDREYMWNIVFMIEETNGVPFTVTTFTETFFNSEQGAGEVYVKTGAECTRFWQTATFQPGQYYGYHVHHPADGFIGYGVAIEGVDHNGNELAFGLYIPLSQEMERVYTPAEFQRETPPEAGEPCIEILPDNDPIPLIPKAEFSGGKGWEFVFALRNVGDAPFTIKRLTQVLFGGEKALDQRVLTPEQLRRDTLAKGDEPVTYNGGASMAGVTAIGVLVEGADPDGNELSFVKYVAFAQE